MNKMPTIYVSQNVRFKYIRIGDLEEPERSQFAEWMVGQTQPLLDELGNNQDACYVWDYETWLEFRDGKPIDWD